MASGSKRQKLKAFIRKPFSSNKNKAVSKDTQIDTSTTSPTSGSSGVVAGELSPGADVLKVVEPASSPQAPEIHASSSGGILNNASHFSMNKPVFVDNSTTNTMVNIHGASDKRSKAMKLLSKHVIEGAAHDSSARDPPPRCHPGTRIEINEHLITWFYDERKKELLIWVYGPAGVGKSAIMQALADKLAEFKHLGASVFISRPNGRNKSQQLFITVAYQLAVHIEDYCTFITEKLDRDPELVNKGMAEQFRSFIVEPFVEKKIGGSGKPWGIVLDGLDELDEHRSQREIIRLIADFVVEHPDVPLLWAIASRPEPHIIDTFDEERIIPAYWKKPIPANSKESSRDVERFLRASLERIQKDFPRTVSKQWPSEEQFSSLAAASSGLFVFADTAIRFIEDPRYANPTMRLRQVLSALSGLPASVSHDQPFASLDILYMSILESIPSEVWLTTKRVLGALLYARGEGRRYVLHRLGSISVLLHLDLSTIYASVNGCYSLLNTPDPKDANWKPVTFYHTSLSDYLLDSTRSDEFYISVEDVEDDLLRSSLTIWQDVWTNYPPVAGLTYGKRLFKYFSALVSYEHSNAFPLLYELRWYIHEALFIFLVEKHDLKKNEPFSSEEDKSQCFDLLHQLEDATICVGFEIIKKLPEFLLWLFNLWEIYQEELASRRIVQDVGLKQVQFSQLGTCPARMKIIQGKSILKEWVYETYDFGKILPAISQLESCFPQLPVLACGSPGKGCLIFRHQANSSDLVGHGLDISILQVEAPVWIYYAIPFPHSNFYHDTTHFLRASFETISANHFQTIPETWPSKEQFQKLAGAVSHQSVFATIAIQFIKNPHYGNSVACLDQLLTLIDEVDPSDDQPFIYVDALYTHILNSISSDMWPTTHQMLCAFLYGITQPDNSTFKSPKGISVVLGIELNAVYAIFSNFSLMVKMPPKEVSLGSIAFNHPSFYEYLLDPTRSKRFYISIEDEKDYIYKLLINIWQDFKKFAHGLPENQYLAIWSKYCSQYHNDTDLSYNTLITDFDQILLYDTHNALLLSVWQYDLVQLGSKQSWDYVFHILSQLDFTTISFGLLWHYKSEFVIWLFAIWNTYEEKLRSRGLFHKIQFQDLQLSHLEWYTIPYHVLHCSVGQRVQKFRGNNPNSPEELEEYISGLQLFQQQRPQLPVLVGGGTGRQFAVFAYEYTAIDTKERLHNPEFGKLRGKSRAGDVGYYILPYPDAM